MSNVPTVIFHGSYTAAATVTLTTTAQINAGQCIYVWVDVNQSGGTPPTALGCTDDAGNAYYLASSGGNSPGYAEGYLYVCNGANAQLNSGQNIYVAFSGAPALTGPAIVWTDNGIGAMTVGPQSAIISGTALNGSWSALPTGYTEVNQYFIGAASAAGIGTPTGYTLVSSQTTNGEAAVFYKTANVTAGTGSVTNTQTSGNGTALILISAVQPPTISVSNPMPSGVQGEAYSQNLFPSGGLSSSYTYAIVGGSLPSGLTIASGVISGTISGSATPGAYAFTVHINDGTITSSIACSLTVVAGGTSGLYAALTPTVPGNLVGLQDQSFEAGGSIHWLANINAGTPVVSSLIGLDGTHSLVWSATAAGDSRVNSANYACTAGATVDAGAFVMPASGVNTTVALGLSFYNGSSWTTVWGPYVTPGFMGQWVPVYCATAVPAGCTQYEILLDIPNAQAADMNHADIIWTISTEAQILIDWVSPSFGPGASAGNFFADVTPWVDVENSTISTSRGRKDAVSEVSPGTASFTLLNDTGWFSPDSFATSLPGVTGGTALDLGARTQINFTDPYLGVWFTRFDGSCNGASYDTSDDSGNTSTIAVACSGVLAYMNRQPTEMTWTQQAILADNPEYAWFLTDTGPPAGASGGAARESSGNGFGQLHAANTDSTAVATIAWGDTTGGVESQADASGPTLDTGQEYWSPGSNVPGSLVRGPIPGAAGPFTTPLGSVALTPVLTAQTAVNYWSGNLGYYLTGMMTGPAINTSTTVEADIELWFSCNPAIQTAVAANSKYGPYIQFSLGGSRSPYSIAAGIFPNGSGGATYQVGLLYNRPGVAGRVAGATPPTFAASCSMAFTPDKVPVPHRLYLQIFASTTTTAAYCQATLDGTVIGTFNLKFGMVFDRIALGAALDGTGCHYGNVSSCAIYGIGSSPSLPGTRNLVHTQYGLYGNFEMTTDNCVAALAAQAQVPPYWNGLTAAGNGLMLADYYDISQDNALVNMQIFEQMEMGLLFENAAGQLMFHTGDWRQGYGAPDLQLPPDTFDGDVQLSRTPQFMQNAVTVDSVAFTSGASVINDNSAGVYGPYFSNYTSAQAAGNYVASAIQLPFFAWNRVAASAGIAGLQFAADPNFTDYANWTSSKFGTPWTVPGQLNFDLLTQDPTLLTISQLYGVDIDNMVVPSGTLPKSWPTNARALEWFIEGVSETFSQNARQLQFFVSPALSQRAWKPGDATYGVLGTTSTVGVSAADVSATEAFGKAVSHDSGRPYWSPDFGAMLGELEVDGDFSSGGLTNWNGYQVTGTFLAAPDANCPAPYAVSLGTWTAGGLFYQSFPCQPNTQYTVSVWVQPASTGTSFGIVEQEFDATETTYLSQTSQPTVTTTTGQWNLLTYTFTTGATTYYLKWGLTSSSNIVCQATRFRLAQGNAGLNNWSANGHDYIGSNEMRGIYDSLALKMRPPILVAAMEAYSVSYTSGTHVVGLTYDTIYADTENGMGLMPGYPNWYVCQRAGWYDIDFSAGIDAPASGSAGPPVQAMITVAIGAAQYGNPTAAAVTYSCPLGAQSRIMVKTIPNYVAGSASLYLGEGDAVNIWLQHNWGSTLATPDVSAGNVYLPAGANLSMLWRGYGRSDNRVGPNASASTGGAVGGGDQWNYYTKKYTSTATYAYGSTHNGYALISTNGKVYQGYVSQAATGSSSTSGSAASQIVFPVAQMRTDITGAGGIVTSATLTGTLQGSSRQGGGLHVYARVGTFDDVPGQSTFNATSNGTPRVYTDLATAEFTKKSAQALTISNSVLTHLLATSTCVIIGDGSSPTAAAKYCGQWNGAKGSWVLTVNYKVQV